MSPVSAQAAPSPPPGSAASTRGWRAELALELAARGPKTSLVSRRHQGPLVVQRPFYPESSGCCHLYLVHPPGGVVGGDELELSLTLHPEAQALVTTPAATKLYRSNGTAARVSQRLLAGRDSRLEWLPQETIAFSGCHACLSTRVELEAGAAFIGSEVLCLGRPAAQELFDSGRLTQRFDVWRQGTPVLSEVLRLSGAGPELSEPWGLNSCTTVATLVALGRQAASAQELSALATQVRSALPQVAGKSSVTVVSEAIVCRFLGTGAQAALFVLRRAWELLRPELFGCPAVRPRIWAT